LFGLHSTKRLVASFLLMTGSIVALSAPASAYDRATIYSQVKNTVTGTVHYAGCRADNFTIAPATVGPTVNQFVTTTETHVTMSAYRGGCLITRIEAKSAGLAIQPYLSQFGTTRARFRVISMPPNANGMTGAVTIY
jgi:hypothetical protein